MTASVDVRGGGPATHETDLLDPTAAVETIHALVLTGGSAYGLAACTGVMLGLEERGIGLPVGALPGELVPIVPGAALFDLGRGGVFRARPTAEFGRAATAGGPVRRGSGRRGRSRRVLDRRDRRRRGAVAGNLKSGVGQASITLSSGIVVAALVVCNAAGSPIDPGTGDLLGARHLLAVDGPRPSAVAADRIAALTGVVYRRPERPAFDFDGDNPIQHTTLAVVATSARLTKAGAQRWPPWRTTGWPARSTRCTPCSTAIWCSASRPGELVRARGREGTRPAGIPRDPHRSSRCRHPRHRQGNAGGPSDQHAGRQLALVD